MDIQPPLETVVLGQESRINYSGLRDTGTRGRYFIDNTHPVGAGASCLDRSIEATTKNEDLLQEPANSFQSTGLFGGEGIDQYLEQYLYMAPANSCLAIMLGPL